MSPDALRRRCARAARKIGRDITAQLGDGVVAVKFGRSWRVRFGSGNLSGACPTAQRRSHERSQNKEERQAHPAH